MLNAEAGGSAMSRLVQFMNNVAKSGAEGTSMLESFASQFGMTGRELEVTVAKGGKPLEKLADSLGMTRKEFKDMYKDANHSSNALQQFAEISGVSAEEFTKSWEKDPAKAVQGFVKGLKRIEDEGGSATSALNGLDIKSVVMIDTFLRLANGADSMDEALESSNKGWKEGTALIEEASKRHETLDSQLTVLRNKLDVISQNVGGPLLEAFNAALDAMSPFLETVIELSGKFADADKNTQQMILKIAGIAMVAGPAIKVLGGLAKVGSGVAKHFADVSVKSKLAKEGFEVVGATAGKEASVGGLAMFGGKIKDITKGIGSKLGGALSAIIPSFGGAAGAATEAGATIATAGGEIAGAGAAAEATGGVVAGLGAAGGALVVGALAFGTFAAAVGIHMAKAFSHTDWFKEHMNTWKNSMSTTFGELKVDLGQTWGKLKDTLREINPFADPTKQAEVFDSATTKATEKALGKYVKLTTEASGELEKLKMAHDTLDEESVKKVTTTYDAMAEEAVKKINERKEKEKVAVKNLLDDVAGIEETDRNQATTKIDEYYGYIERRASSHKDEINKIVKTAADEKRTLSNEEYSEVVRLQDEMDKYVTTALTQSATEQEVILTRTKSNKEKLSTEMSAKIIKDSIEQKDKTVKAAADERDGKIAEAIAMEKVGVLTAKQRDVVVANAEDQYKKSVKSAKNMHDETVTEVINQGTDVQKEIDISTGEAKTSWDKFYDGMAGIFKKVGKSFTETYTVVDGDTSLLSASVQGQWDKNNKNISKNAKQGTDNAKKEFDKKMPQIDKVNTLATENIQKKTLNMSTSIAKSSKDGTDKSNREFSLKMPQIKKMNEINVDKIRDKTSQMERDMIKNSKKATGDSKTIFDDVIPKISKTTEKSAKETQKSWENMTDGIAKDSKTGTKKSSSAFDWIMEAIGGKKISSVFPYAKGTPIGGHKGGHALINDQKGSNYREMVALPNGKTFMPEGRNVLLPNLPKGAEVLNASDTQTLLQSGFSAYKKGTGGFLSNLVDKAKGAFSKVKDWSMDIWDWVADKTKIKQLMASKTGNYEKSDFKFNNSYHDLIQEKILEASSSNIFEEAEMMGGVGGDFDGEMGSHGVYKYLVDIANQTVRKFGMESGITSGYRPGDPAWHGKHQAIDVAFAPNRNGSKDYFKAADWVYEKFRNQVAYVITQGKVRDRSGLSGQPATGSWGGWPDNDHYDHLHINGLLGQGQIYQGHGGGSPMAGANAERWRGQIKRASQMMNAKANPREIDGIVKQIQRESNGNEKVTQSMAVWDENAQSGNLAKGLLQYVPSTFNAYKVKGFGNILNGFHQIMAFFNNSRWRSDLPYGRSGWTPNGGRVKGFHNGGIITKDQIARVGEGNKPEMVVPLTRKTRAIALMQQAQDMMGIGPNSDNTVVGIMQAQNDKIDKLIEIVQYMALNSDKQQPIIVNGNRVDTQEISEDLATLSQRGRFNLGGTR